MQPREHVILGSTTAAALYPALGYGSVPYFIASVAIDIDHYMDFVYHNGFREFGLRRMFEYHGILRRHWRSPRFLSIEALHTAEFMAAFGTAAFLAGSTVLKAAWLGFLFHIALDAIYMLKHGIFRARANSVIGYFVKKRRMAEKGLNPEGLYDDVVAAMGVKVV